APWVSAARSDCCTAVRIAAHPALRRRRGPRSFGGKNPWKTAIPAAHAARADESRTHVRWLRIWTPRLGYASGPMVAVTCVPSVWRGIIGHRPGTDCHSTKHPAGDA